MPKRQWNKQHSVTPDPVPEPVAEPPSVTAAEPAPVWRRKRWNPAAAAVDDAPASATALVPASSVAADEAQARENRRLELEAISAKQKEDPTYRPPSGIQMHKGID